MAENEMNAGDRRQRMPDAAEIPEAQEDFGQTGDTADPVSDALKTLAEFAAEQEGQGNPGIKQALATFMQSMLGVQGGPAEGAVEQTEAGAAEAVGPGAEGMVEEAVTEQDEGVPPGREPIFNPFEAPDEQEDEEMKEKKRKKEKNKNKTIVNA